MRLDSTSFDSTEMIQSFVKGMFQVASRQKSSQEHNRPPRIALRKFDGRFGFFWRAKIKIAFRIQVWAMAGNAGSMISFFTARKNLHMDWWNRWCILFGLNIEIAIIVFCGWNDSEGLDLFSAVFSGIQGENLLQAHHTSASISCWKYRLLELWRCWWLMAVARNSWSHKSW